MFQIKSETCAIIYVQKNTLHNARVLQEFIFKKNSRSITIQLGLPPSFSHCPCHVTSFYIVSGESYEFNDNFERFRIKEEASKISNIIIGVQTQLLDIPPIRHLRNRIQFLLLLLATITWDVLRRHSFYENFMLGTRFE